MEDSKVIAEAMLPIVIMRMGKASNASNAAIKEWITRKLNQCSQLDTMIQAKGYIDRSKIPKQEDGYTNIGTLWNFIYGGN